MSEPTEAETEALDFGEGAPASQRPAPAPGDEAAAPALGDEAAAPVLDPLDAGEPGAADPLSIVRERDEYLALAQRLQAELENFKKATIRRNTEVIERAGADLAEKLLPVLDAMDNAIIHGVDGVGPIHKALLEVLQRQGLEVVPVEGQFDPAHHEAVLHEPANEDDDHAVVTETLRTGYSWKGRVLRPAMVKVRG